MVTKVALADALFRFPPDAHVTASNMNYAVLVFGVVILFSAVYYILVGRNRFIPTLRKNE